MTEKKPLKFLCFHGAGANGKHFEQMLWHLRENFHADNTATLHFIDGLIEAIPSQIPTYESDPPHLSHYDTVRPVGFAEMTLDDDFAAIALREGYNNNIAAEDSMRVVNNTPIVRSDEVVQMTHDYIQQVVDEEGPFHGVIGASEGSMAAASFLMRDLERCRKNNLQSSFRCGIFIVGVPAINDRGRWILSDDDSGLRITIPTCHIIGEKDPIRCAAVALMNTCDPTSRVLISHEEGHIIPHGPDIMRQVGDFVRRVRAEG